MMIEETSFCLFCDSEFKKVNKRKFCCDECKFAYYRAVKRGEIDPDDDGENFNPKHGCFDCRFGEKAEYADSGYICKMNFGWECRPEFANLKWKGK